MSKIYSGIMGLVVGDALGVPVEFNRRDSFHVTDMIGYGTYDLPPGTWSRGKHCPTRTHKHR